MRLDRFAMDMHSLAVPRTTAERLHTHHRTVRRESPTFDLILKDAYKIIKLS